MKQRPNILTIAGFDPTSGAGLTADIKTMEALKCYGLSICTANTIQTDKQFIACHWTASEIVIAQLKTVLDRFEIAVVKIGVIQSWDLLVQVLAIVKEANPTIKVVWDPVLGASTDFEFHTHEAASAKKIVQALQAVYMVTPNYLELQALFPTQSIIETRELITKHTNLLVKGGHRADALGKDELYTQEGNQYTLNPKMKGCTDKHGSGCVLSSAIASYVGLGFPLLKACYRAKRYTEKVLVSNKSLLGFHRV